MRFSDTVRGLQKGLAIVVLLPALAWSAAVERESSWVIPDLMMQDKDGDGIADQNDRCPSTGLGKIVDQVGCGLSVNQSGEDQVLVRFGFDEDRVDPRYFQALESFALRIKNRPDRLIELSGHADPIGSIKYNLDLSERRAKSVADILVQMYSVDPDQIKVVGYGDRRPSDLNVNSLNRRVQAEGVELQLVDQFQKTVKSD